MENRRIAFSSTPSAPGEPLLVLDPSCAETLAMVAQRHRTPRLKVVVTATANMASRDWLEEDTRGLFQICRLTRGSRLLDCDHQDQSGYLLTWQTSQHQLTWPPQARGTDVDICWRGRWCRSFLRLDVTLMMWRTVDLKAGNSVTWPLHVACYDSVIRFEFGESDPCRRTRLSESMGRSALSPLGLTRANRVDPYVWANSVWVRDSYELTGVVSTWMLCLFWTGPDQVAQHSPLMQVNRCTRLHASTKKFFSKLLVVRGGVCKVLSGCFLVWFFVI